MTEDGKNILAATRQVRTLFLEISQLLATVDAMMRELGWEAGAANTCIAEGSRSIQWPQNWIPYVIFRFFRHKESPASLVAVSVILDDDDIPTRITEPLVSGIVYHYGEGNEVPNSWEYEYAGWHIYSPGARDDGSVSWIDPRQIWAKDGVTAVRVGSFAVPLAEIINSGSLKGRVVSVIDKMARL